MTNAIHEPGIYFDLPADEYHEDPALGSTAIKAIATDPFDYQDARLHGEEKDSRSLLWGQALHTRVLEGRAAFDAQFSVSPDKAAYPGLLETMDDLRGHARKIGAKNAAKKSDIIANIRAIDKEVPIWEEIDEAHEAEHAGKINLDRKLAAEIERAAIWMQADPKLAPFMKEGQLVAGLSEVSIFYWDNGVRLKCRFDHLLKHAILDLKSFRPAPGWNVGTQLNKVLGRVIAQNRYDLQAAAYMRSMAAATVFVAKGHVFHTIPANRTRNELVASAAFSGRDLKWIWVLVKNSGAPEPFVREFPRSGHTYGASMIEVNAAIDTYRALSGEFGDDKDWTPRHNADAFDDTDFPAYLGL